jgi:hypothetical protein
MATPKSVLNSQSKNNISIPINKISVNNSFHDEEKGNKFVLKILALLKGRGTLDLPKMYKFTE